MYKQQEKKRICPHCAAEISASAHKCEFCDHKIKHFRPKPNEVESDLSKGQAYKSLFAMGALIAVAALAWLAVPTEEKSTQNQLTASNAGSSAIPDRYWPSASSLSLAADAAKDIYTKSLPTKLNQYTITKISRIGNRLESEDGTPDTSSGDLVEYEVGTSQVSYSTIPGLASARVGDPVKLQLIALPAQFDGSPCPPGDNRGSTYRVTDLRTKETWEASDSTHSCGGA